MSRILLGYCRKWWGKPQWIWSINWTMKPRSWTESQAENEMEILNKRTPQIINNSHRAEMWRKRKGKNINKSIMERFWHAVRNTSRIIISWSFKRVYNVRQNVIWNSLVARKATNLRRNKKITLHESENSR